MAVQPVLAGTTLPHVAQNGFRRRRTYRGGRREMASGAQAVDLVNTNPKHVFDLEWPALTSAELATVQTAVAAVKDTAGNFTSPENVTYTVQLDITNPELIVEMFRASGADRFRVSLRLRED